MEKLELTKASKEKAKFRNTSQWKKFRKEMYKNANGKDFVTGKPLRKGWQLHHLDMSLEHYKNLTPGKFVCLNKTTHEIVHFIYRYPNYKTLLKHLEYILDDMTILNDIEKIIKNNKEGIEDATGTQEN